MSDHDIPVSPTTPEDVQSAAELYAKLALDRSPTLSADEAAEALEAAAAEVRER
jgi:hypothetical protein